MADPATTSTSKQTTAAASGGTTRGGGYGMGKRLELLKSLKEIDTKHKKEKAKMTIMKRSKAIRKPQSAKQPRTTKASVKPI